MQSEYIFHADPGHAWLEVPAHEARLLKILPKISDYSYRTMASESKEETFYLEEDCDAGVFLEARKKFSPFTIKYEHTDDESEIRDYERL